MENTKHLVGELERIGLAVPIEPIMNICGILVDNPSRVRDELEKRNWKVSLSRHPDCLRVVVMPHVTKPVIDAFVRDLEDCC